MNNYKPGVNSVPEYQISAIPWVTESNVSSGVTKFSFPYVTNFITVRNNTAATIKFGFTLSGTLGSNNFSLATSGSYDGSLRLKEIYVSASQTSGVTILAGLTSIQSGDLFTLTGSNGHQGVG
jgi:hypothetical protein